MCVGVALSSCPLESPLLRPLSVTVERCTVLLLAIGGCLEMSCFVLGVNEVNVCLSAYRGTVTFESEHTLLQSVCCVTSTPFALLVNLHVVFCMTTWSPTSEACLWPCSRGTGKIMDRKFVSPWRNTVRRLCDSGVSRRRRTVQDWYCVRDFRPTGSCTSIGAFVISEQHCRFDVVCLWMRSQKEREEEGRKERKEGESHNFQDVGNFGNVSDRVALL